MAKFIPYEKLSKKEKRKMDLAKRQTWGELNPVTRKPENSRAYNRKRTQDWKKEFPDLRPFIYLSASLSEAMFRGASLRSLVVIYDSIQIKKPTTQQAKLPDVWWVFLLVRDLQFHADINGVGGQAIQGLDFLVTAAVIQICFGNFIQRIAPDNGVDAMGLLRIGGRSLFCHRVDRNTIIGENAVAWIVVRPLLCV